MNIFTRYFLIAALLGLGNNFSYSKSIFEQMLNEMEQMEHYFDQQRVRMHEQLKNFCSRESAISMSENKATNSFEIIVSPLVLKEKTMDAMIDKEANTVTLTFEQGNLNLKAFENQMRVQYTNYNKNENTKENSASVESSMHMIQTLPGKLKLEDVAIEYNTEAQRLLISLPFAKRIVTKIPVTIKTSEKSELNK